LIVKALQHFVLITHGRKSMKAAKVILGCVVIGSLAGFEAVTIQQKQAAPEAHTVDGKALYRIELPVEQRKQLEANLSRAEAEYKENPRDPERIIWYGRRLAYLWRYQDAIRIFTKGIELHPNYAKLYRHRGHRFITVREFDRAIADLEKAASLIAGVPDEIEPDGAPNKYNIPTSTTNSNIWYHLGLAYYLKGDFENALRAYRECMKFSTNEDMLCATSDWLYMTLRRMGKKEEADKVLEGIRKEMKILENHAYHNRLLMYKGELSPEELLSPSDADEVSIATQGYGVGNWYLFNGQSEKAIAVFRNVVAGKHWAAFGSIAAEVELTRFR
jgi:tetratricopeptide (TPR) repeat protein